MTGFFDQLTGKPSAKPAATEDDDTTDGLVQAPSDAAQSALDERTETRLRDATQELLKYGLLEAEQKPNLYRIATVQQEQINSILEPLDLVATVDDIRGLVFLTVRPTATADSSDDADWSHPLVRKQRLTLEQSLMVALLRQIFVAH